MLELSRTRELLERKVRACHWGSGASVAVRGLGDQRYTWNVGVDGVGDGLQHDSLFAVYCAAKPVVALTVACLRDDGLLDWDDALERFTGGPAHSQVSVRSLLNHTAGYGHLFASTYAACSATERRQLALNTSTATNRRSLAYAEFASWELLALIIEASMKRPFIEIAIERILAPIGIADDLKFAVDPDHADRVRINLDLSLGRRSPLLWDREAVALEDPNPAIGCYSTMSGLAALYIEVERARRDQSKVVSADSALQMTTTDIKGLDRTMNRVSSFGLGFMTDLETHGFGTWIEPEAFGHSGLAGMTFGFCLPSHGMSVAVHTNGLIDGPEVLNRRIEIVDSILADIGENGI